MDPGRSNHSVQKFLDSSIALIEARPNTTRIVSRYRVQTEKEVAADARKHGSKDSSSTPASHIGFYRIKTYDPVSGACLRIKIRKASELNRIMNVLGEVMVVQLSGHPSETTKPLDKNTAIHGIRATKLPTFTSSALESSSAGGSADVMDLDHKDLPASIAKGHAQSSSGTASPSTVPNKASKKKKNKRR